MILDTVCNNILDKNVMCTKAAVTREILQSYSQYFWKGNKNKTKNVQLFYKDSQNKTTKLNLGTLFLAQGGQKISHKKCLPHTPSSPPTPPRVDMVNERTISSVNDRGGDIHIHINVTCACGVKQLCECKKTPPPPPERVKQNAVRFKIGQQVSEGDAWQWSLQALQNENFNGI